MNALTFTRRTAALYQANGSGPTYLVPECDTGSVLCLPLSTDLFYGWLHANCCHTGRSSIGRTGSSSSSSHSRSESSRISRWLQQQQQQQQRAGMGMWQWKRHQQQQQQQNGLSSLQVCGYGLLLGSCLVCFLLVTPTTTPYHPHISPVLFGGGFLCVCGGGGACAQGVWVLGLSRRSSRRESSRNSRRQEQQQLVGKRMWQWRRHQQQEQQQRLILLQVGDDSYVCVCLGVAGFFYNQCQPTPPLPIFCFTPTQHALHACLGGLPSGSKGFDGVGIVVVEVSKRHEQQQQQQGRSSLQVRRHGLLLGSCLFGAPAPLPLTAAHAHLTMPLGGGSSTLKLWQQGVCVLALHLCSAYVACATVSGQVVSISLVTVPQEMGRHVTASAHTLMRTHACSLFHLLPECLKLTP